MIVLKPHRDRNKIVQIVHAIKCLCVPYVLGTTSGTKKIIAFMLLVIKNKYVGILISLAVVFGYVHYHLRIVISGGSELVVVS
jgi:hypothetical protein